MEENHDWKSLNSHLYDNLRPQGTILRQGFSFGRHGRPEYPYLYVEVEKNEFDYEDPFYGHQSSLSMFEMTVDLRNDACFSGISHPSQLANRSFVPAISNRMGVFSNSLDVTVHQIIFGQLDAEARQLSLRLEYSFTNSDSYGMMTGTLADHRQTSGIIESNMRIEHPVVMAKKETDVLSAIRQLDTQLYATELAVLAEDINGISHPDHVRYAVPYRNLTHLLKKGNDDQVASGSTATKNKDSWLSALFKNLGK